jgi:predicted SPOUT superfamily RNA methylase MTH1
MSNFPKSVLTIGTSRFGTSIDQVTYPKVIPNEIWLFFGSRDNGLRGFFGSFDEFKSGFDLILNTFPNSHTKSIRLEEAIPISLNFLDSFEKFKN